MNDRVGHWKRDKLSWLLPHLTPAERAEYDALVAQYGEPTLADRNHRSFFRSGSQSPFSLQELQSLDHRSVIARVLAWREGDTWRGPTTEGLLDTFQRLTETDASQWSESAGLVVVLPISFIGRFFSGMQSAVKAGTIIAWDPVLTLAEYSFSRYVTIDSEEEEGQRWFQAAVLDLIKHGCERSVDVSMRARFLALIGRVRFAEDISNIIDSGPVLRRDLDLDCLNSIRGRCAETVCELLRWSAVGAGANLNGNTSGFPVEEFSDIVGVIERHLSVDAALNIALFGSYGMRVGLLQWFNGDWFRSRVVTACDLGDVQSESIKFGAWSFWLQFLRHHQPHIVWFQAFAQHYEKMAMWMERASEDDRREIEGVESYLQHLIMYHFWNCINLQDGGVLVRAMDHALVSQRLQLIGYIGRMLEQSDSIPADVIAAMQRFWEWYWNRFGEADADTLRGEHHSGHPFGHWYASGLMPVDWALHVLLSALERSRSLASDDEVLDRLLIDLDAAPNEVFRCVGLMVEGDVNRWKMYMWKDKVRALLDRSSAGDEAMRLRGAALLDLLTRHGHFFA